MASVSGFGRTGPMAKYAAFHSGVNFASGFGSVTGHPGGRPRIMGSLLPDAVSSLFWLFAVLAALEERRRSGKGQYIDVSMSEVLMHLMPEAIFDYCVNSREPQFLGNRDRVNAPQGIYRCKGWDAWIGVSIETDAQWRALCRAIGQPRLARDPRYATHQARQARHDELDAVIAGWTRQRTLAEAAAILQTARVPAGPSLNPKDLLNDLHLASRGFVRAIDHPTAGRRRMLGVPWRISRAAPVKYGRAPLLGEHSSQVLKNVLGMSDEQIESLVTEKVLY
jgi:crotonobetainyl-CoA:carnitine CoA-transferase CaiB-like acyl-CoA transferase